MRITYDEAKNRRNEEARGLSFASVERFDWSDALIVEDMRKDYGERR